MRGAYQEPVRGSLTFLIGVFVVFGLWMFGNAIFNAGARITILASASGGCACVDADPNVDIKCAGEATVKCPKCSLGSGNCQTTQSVSLESVLKYPLKKVQICTIVAGPGQFDKSSTKLKINGKAIENIEGANRKENCIEHDFSPALVVKNVEAQGFYYDDKNHLLGTHLDRLIARWETDDIAIN